MRHILSILAAALLATAARAAYREVPVTVEPPQSLKAVSLRAGDATVAVAVRDGKMFVPDDVPLPFTVSLLRFESAPYTATDLEQHRTFVIREFGHVRGVLPRSKSPVSERFTLLLRRSRTGSVDEISVTVAQDRAFNVQLPADVYDIAAVGDSSATRIRSAVVVAPGRITDVGAMPCDDTVRVTLRVMDAGRHAPVRHAAVVWDPPNVLNADVARSLYARKWSATTDANGIVTFNAMGPLPLPVRWRVNADGYAVAESRVLQLHELRATAIPDVEVRLQAEVTVRVHLPRDAGSLRQAALVFADAPQPGQRRPNVLARAPLRDGETAFTARTYGPGRLMIENQAGVTLLYRDFTVDNEKTIVDLAPSPIDVYGRVTRRDQPIGNAIVRAADPHNAQTVIALARTAQDGTYRFSTWQTGAIYVYATPATQPGRQSFPVSETLHTTGSTQYQLDFALPDGGAAIRVIDAITGAPLHATIDKRVDFGENGGTMGIAETDDDGTFALDGFPEGTAHLMVRAPGHYTKEIRLQLTSSSGETLVKLDRSDAIVGHVVDTNGSPISGARVTGGYLDERTPQPFFEAITDASGRFSFDAAPPQGTLFYIAAPRCALGIATLQSDHENVVQLAPPGRGGAVLRPDDAPPVAGHLVMASPAGGDYIPMGALYDLAEVNGLNPFQLQGSGRDGVVALPRFLPPGTYTFYVAEKGGPPYRYQRIGSTTLPAESNVIFAYREH